MKQETKEKIIEDLHEILWHLPIGNYNWNRVVKVILNIQPERKLDLVEEVAKAFARIENKKTLNTQEGDTQNRTGDTQICLNKEQIHEFAKACQDMHDEMNDSVYEAVEAVLNAQHPCPECEVEMEPFGTQDIGYSRFCPNCGRTE